MLMITRESFSEELDKILADGENIFQLRQDPQSPKEAEDAKREFELWNDYNIEFLKSSFNYTGNEYRSSYEQAGEFSIPMNLGYTPREHHIRLLERFKSKLDNLNALKNKVKLLKYVTPKETLQHSNNKIIAPTSEIFIVHGHDDVARLEVSRFLEKLGFLPIILHEQASGSKTIIEKIEGYSNVGFAVVLYTPCDIGFKKGNDNDAKNRARQNVVFEHGYLIGKIGRQNVCALVKGDVETPNDISGMVYVPMDSHHGWQLRLAREMKNSGYDLDLNKV